MLKGSPACGRTSIASGPILENTQDYGALSAAIKATLAKYPRTHGILIRRHGLYAWGSDLAEAKRHVEILEFLFEVRGRLQTAGAASPVEV